LRQRNIVILLAILLVLVLVIYFTTSSGGTPAPPEPQWYVWSIDMDAIEHIEINLLQEGESRAFFKGEDRLWYFDDAQHTPVDMVRWGGGIPLLLSGPGAERIVAEDASEEELAIFGLTQPRMEITLVLDTGETVHIIIGDDTPDGGAFYVKAPGSNSVATVDYSWYDIMEGLVKDPPYVTAETG